MTRRLVGVSGLLAAGAIVIMPACKSRQVELCDQQGLCDARSDVTGDSDDAPAACTCDVDLNQDGLVNAVDVAIVVECSRLAVTSACGGCRRTGTCLDADLSCDGAVTQCDDELATCVFEHPSSADCCAMACP